MLSDSIARLPLEGFTRDEMPEDFKSMRGHVPACGVVHPL